MSDIVDTRNDYIDLLLKRIEGLESLCVEAANELTKTLPADHPLRVKLEQAGDGKEIGT